MGKHVDTTPEQPDRRRLLRAGGAAVAGAVGVGVVTGLPASPASAAPGDSLILGQTNDAGRVGTTLTSHQVEGFGSTLILGNSATIVDIDGHVRASPSLRLVPNGEYVDGDLGAIGMSADGEVWVHSGDGPDVIRTRYNTSVVYPLKPSRALDTYRNRENILNAFGNIDSANRLVAGNWLHLNLGRFFGYGTVLYANLSVLGASSPGWAVVVPYPGTGVPTTSSINFQPGQSLSNAVVVGLGWEGEQRVDSPRDAISIYASVNVRVILDITAVTVWHESQIQPVYRQRTTGGRGETF